MTDFNKVKQDVKDLAFDNFEMYPEDWAEGDFFLNNLANGYWETRNDSEIETDKKLGITKKDYQNFVYEANEEIIEEANKWKQYIDIK